MNTTASPDIPIPDWVEAPDPGMPDPRVIYYENTDIILTVEYYNHQQQCSRIAGPAAIGWHSNGIKWGEFWRKDGGLHRTDGPARIEWNIDGTAFRRTAWMVDNAFHRTDGPADVEWYADGVKKVEKWYQNGLLHRTDGPAVEHWYADGTHYVQAWWENGNLLAESEYKDGELLTRYVA